jgi:hypothetical protein
MMKRVDNPGEWELAEMLSSSPFADARNHCVPIYEILKVPESENHRILVMPLRRRFVGPRFETFGEAVDFFGQVFEVLSVGSSVYFSTDCFPRASNSCTTAMLLIGA